MPARTHSPVDADARIAGSLDFEPMTTQPSTVPPRAPRPLLVEWMLAGTATMSACLFTNPAETIKTRMQLQGELVAASSLTGPAPPRVYSNVFSAFAQVARTEGIRGLQGGLGPSLLYQLTMNGTRLGLYEPLKRLVERVAGDDSAAREPRLGDRAYRNRPPVFWQSMVAAAASGCIAAFIGSPFFLVKVRLQVQNKALAPLVAAAVQPTVAAAGAASVAVLPSAIPGGAPLAVGAQHAYTSALGGLRSIYAADGVPGLFRGATASMVRVMIGGTVQLTTYDSMKFAVMQRTGWHDSVKVQSVDTQANTVAASSLSGFLVTVAMNPADVISTRLYNQPVVNGQGQLYTGLVDCATKTVRTEGVRGLYKGFLAHYLRIGPHTLLTFIFWEQIKAAATKAGI